MDAIVSLGSGVEEGLAEVLRDPLADRNRRLGVPRVLARLGSASSARVLCEALDTQDEALRTQILVALSRLPRNSPAPDRALVQRALELELTEAHRLLSCAENLGLPEQPSGHAVSPNSAEGAAVLLALALDEERFRSLERVLLLLGLLLSRLRAANLRPDLFRMQPSSEGAAPGHRGFALELLDNLLPRDLGLRLLPLWDSGPRQQRLADLLAFYPDSATTRGGWLEWTRAGTTPWLHACVVLHAAYIGRRLSAASMTRSELPTIPGCGKRG